MSMARRMRSGTGDGPGICRKWRPARRGSLDIGRYPREDRDEGLRPAWPPMPRDRFGIAEGPSSKVACRAKPNAHERPRSRRTTRSPTGWRGRSRARCCSTRPAAGATRPMPRSTRSSRSAWSCPKSLADVEAARADRARGGRSAAAARRRHLAVRPDRRAGRWSSTTPSISTDVVEIDVEAATCLVEPGIVLDELNRQLKADGPLVSGRRLDIEPRDDRRHDRQQLVRHALDPLRHHARQRAGDRRDAGRRHARRISARCRPTSQTINAPDAARDLFRDLHARLAIARPSTFEQAFPRSRGASAAT